MFQLRLHLHELLLRRSQFAREVLAAGEQRSDILAVALALAFGHADGLGVRVALRAQPIGFDLQGLALLLESLEGLDVECESTARQIAGHGFGV